MIRRLTILLLIVGCAPTKPPAAQFYIGMTEKEYKKINPNFKVLASYLKRFQTYITENKLEIQ